MGGRKIKDFNYSMIVVQTRPLLCLLTVHSNALSCYVNSLGFKEIK